MSTANKWLSLPIGTKVRRKKDGDTITRTPFIDDTINYVRFIDSKWRTMDYSDNEWELIEEKQEPKQGDEIKFGDMVYAKDILDKWFDYSPLIYLGKKDWKYHTLWFYESLGQSDDLFQLLSWDEVKKAPTKIELTIEEIEEKLGYEKGSLSIK